MLQELIEDLDCSNGYAEKYIVLGSIEDAAYPGIEKYFQNLGLEAGDVVIIHHTW